MTTPLEPTEIPSNVMEDAVVGDTDVIAAATSHAVVGDTDVHAAATNHVAGGDLTQEIAPEALRTDASAFTSAATGEEKEEQETTKKKRRVTGEKRTRRVGIPAPRKDAKLEDPPQAGSGVDATYKVLSKHDEKWNKMLEALLEYKKEHNSTMVPQCYDQDQRLGRWVHYQRGMHKRYWLLSCPSLFMR
jgi:hypothetical protein